MKRSRTPRFEPDDVQITKARTFTCSNAQQAHRMDIFSVIKGARVGQSGSVCLSVVVVSTHHALGKATPLSENTTQIHGRGRIPF